VIWMHIQATVHLAESLEVELETVNDTKEETKSNESLCKCNCRKVGPRGPGWRACPRDSAQRHGCCLALCEERQSPDGDEL
jgi:hypothetical protein